MNLVKVQSVIHNVLIVSPKGNWRQVGVPNKSWRLSLHMLNEFISYIYEGHLPHSLYNSFIYNRGCKSCWEDILWSNWLQNYPYISEVDLRSGFPNSSILKLREALLDDQLIPPNLQNLIIQHMRSPLRESDWFPT